MNPGPALLIIDMQKGSFTPKTPRFDTERVVKRMNELEEIFRNSVFLILNTRREKIRYFTPK